MIFLNNFRIETFLKNTPFNSLKNVRAENEEMSWEIWAKNTALRLPQTLSRLVVTTSGSNKTWD
mgnify:CR=1 FL=1